MPFGPRQKGRVQQMFFKCVSLLRASFDGFSCCFFLTLAPLNIFMKRKKNVDNFCFFGKTVLLKLCIGRSAVFLNVKGASQHAGSVWRGCWEGKCSDCCLYSQDFPGELSSACLNLISSNCVWVEGSMNAGFSPQSLQVGTSHSVSLTLLLPAGTLPQVATWDSLAFNTDFYKSHFIYHFSF